MFQAGKRWVEELEKDNRNLSVLARAHAYLVENPFFLFVGAGIFLWEHTYAHMNKEGKRHDLLFTQITDYACFYIQ